MTTMEVRHVTLMSKMEERLLAKINAFKGKFNNLRTDVNDHERRLVALSSGLLKQESVLKGYKDTNDATIATLRTDVNNNRAKIPKLHQEIQDSTVGLVTSIKEIKALVHDLRQQQQEPVNRETTTSAHTPVWGASVDPPPTPSTNRFNLPGGLNPTFQGTACFPSGNRPPRDMDAPPDPGDHQDNHSMGGTPAPTTPSPVSQGGLCWDPSAVDLTSLSGGNPPP